MKLHPTALDLTNQRFDRLVALRPTGGRRDNKLLWECRCDCGGTMIANSASLMSGQVRSCGCLRREGRALAPGDRYAGLTVLAYAGGSMWRCRCDCGNETAVQTSNLRRGRIKSCGCKQAHRTHGLSGHPMYKRWHAMVARCSSPKHDNYLDYGGRGIRVCERWLSFENFLADLGQAPTGLSLDRIDVNGNYEPGNVRWATQSVQASNKRTARVVTIDRLSIDEIEAILAAKKEAALGIFG